MFKRRVRQYPKCMAYQCGERAIVSCNLCGALLCSPCANGHAAYHAKKEMKEEMLYTGCNLCGALLRSSRFDGHAAYHAKKELNHVR